MVFELLLRQAWQFPIILPKFDYFSSVWNEYPSSLTLLPHPPRGVSNDPWTIESVMFTSILSTCSSTLTNKSHGAVVGGTSERTSGLAVQEVEHRHRLACPSYGSRSSRPSACGARRDLNRVACAASVASFLQPQCSHHPGTGDALRCVRPLSFCWISWIKSNPDLWPMSFCMRRLFLDVHPLRRT